MKPRESMVFNYAITNNNLSGNGVSLKSISVCYENLAYNRQGKLWKQNAEPGVCQFADHLTMQIFMTEAMPIRWSTTTASPGSQSFLSTADLSAA